MLTSRSTACNAAHPTSGRPDRHSTQMLLSTYAHTSSTRGVVFRRPGMEGLLTKSITEQCGPRIRSLSAVRVRRRPLAAHGEEPPRLSISHRVVNSAVL